MRCFIAIHLDDAIKSQLASAQAYFADLRGKVSWTKREQMHLTIKFLGEVPDERIKPVTDVLRTCAVQVDPFEFPVEQLGCFPASGSQLRILWVGVSAPAELVKLNDLLQQSYVELGYPAENRKFTPHLTIARVRHTNNADAYRTVIARHDDFSAGSQQAESVILFRSDLRATGAVYTRLATIPFGKSP